MVERSPLARGKDPWVICCSGQEHRRMYHGKHSEGQSKGISSPQSSPPPDKPAEVWCPCSVCLLPPRLLDGPQRAGKEGSSSVHDKTMGLQVAEEGGQSWSQVRIPSWRSKPVLLTLSKFWPGRTQEGPVGPRMQEFHKEWKLWAEKSKGQG